MKRRSTFRRLWAAPLLITLAMAGCGSPAVDTGPAEEPNIGPGGPPGMGKISFDPSAKPGTKAEAKGGSKAEAKGGAASGKSSPGK